MKIGLWLKRCALAGLLAMLALAAMPVTAAYAVGASDPPPPSGEVSAERLERLWHRRQRAHHRLGVMLERADGLIEHVQERLDQAAADGKDVTALQAALDSFADAVAQARAPYDEATEILETHSGFDESGKVTDQEQAAATIHALGEKLHEVRELIGRPSHALREALRAFREANHPADSTEN